MLMAYEVTAGLPTRATQPTRPGEEGLDGEILDGLKPAIVPILRSGLAIAEGFREVMPSVRTGHLGLLNVKGQPPVEYLIALPETQGRVFIIVDAIIATGDIAKRAVELLVKYDAAVQNILFCAVVATDTGIAHLHDTYPQVHVYVSCLGQRDPVTNEINPSLGDVGDRLFFGLDHKKKDSRE